MELYDTTSQAISRLLMQSYSTSFSSSTFLFPPATRRHIYNIYGLVRIADEIVDSYGGKDALSLLDNLEKEVFDAVSREYSTNPIVHSFALTAKQYTLDARHISAFFKSMRLDLSPQTYTDNLYKEYIHGSAEVIGLMCLPILCDGDKQLVKALSDGARHLGAAYQKVNFLRDLRADHEELGRLYFPGLTYTQFDDEAKMAIIRDIKDDFALALPTINQLPKRARPAIWLSYRYYTSLLKKLERASAHDIKSKRIRLTGLQKSLLFVQVIARKAVSL